MKLSSYTPSRRTVLQGAAALGATLTAAGAVRADDPRGKPTHFLYNEMQAAVPFDQMPWDDLNPKIRAQPGLLNKTWLSGLGTNSVGGFYEFDSLEAVHHYAHVFLPNEARNFGTAQTSIIFDALAVEEASRDLNSPHFGGALSQMPGAFVYTEVQVDLPFDQAPWKVRNPVLKAQPGLLAKTWLSGQNTRTIGGFDVFDTIENAKAFVIDAFPETAKQLGAAYVTKIFDGAVVAKASRDMNSPYFS